MTDYEDYKIGINDHIIQVRGMNENQHIIEQMMRQATSSIEIISRLLDPPVYDQPGFIEAVRNFVTHNRRVLLRIIVFDPVTIVRNGHGLVNLATYLSSFIQIRKMDYEYRQYNQGLFVADKTAYVHKSSANRYDAIANFNDRRESYFLLKDFEIMWESSSVDPNLRRMRV